MAPANNGVRRRSYGQAGRLTAVDRFGVWLSARQVRRAVRDFGHLRVADLGCGYRAAFGRSVLGEVDRLFLVDVALDPALRAEPKVTAIEGVLPRAAGEIGDGAADVVLCNSVLEHLWEPEAMLRECWRIMAPGGTLLVNVPSWRGKRFLETSAFRLGLSPVEEMQDHKMYYDPRDLWPLLVRAGFKPRDIRCFRHKFGLNTFAACRKPARAGE
jgi:SAM-dependent methyltransferase